jgi:hypothetical protein
MKNKLFINKSEFYDYDYAHAVKFRDGNRDGLSFSQHHC